MIWIFLFFFVNLFNLKEFMMLNKYMELKNMNNFLLIISPFFMFMSYSIMFNSLDSQSKIKADILFFVVIIFSNMMFYTTSVFLMILFIEMAVYPMLKLFMNQSKDKDKKESITFMFMTNISGSLIMFFFITKMKNSMFYFNCNTLDYTSVFKTEVFMFLMYSFMLLTKVPLMFMQFWLSKAHVSASMPCSMILASILLKLGSFGMLKFSFLMNFIFKRMESLIFSVSVYSMLIMVLLMIRFSDSKIMVAYSSILHMALPISFILQYNNSSTLSSLLMLTSHGLISCMFFFFVGLLYEISMNRSMEFIKNYESFNKNISFMMFLVIFLNLGIPPMSNFYSEMIYIMCSFKYSIILSLILGVSMVFTIMFCMYMMMKISSGKKIYLIKKNMTMNSMMSLWSLCMIFYISFNIF